MQLIYRAILRLYPAEYRAVFASEMVATFDQAAADSGKRGILHFVLFATCEFAGLLKGLFTERMARRAAQDGYITTGCLSTEDTQLPAEIVEVQNRLARLLRGMEFAIAHHDFPKARFYSNEERVTRAMLERLMDEYKQDKPFTVPTEMRRSSGYA